MAENRVLKKAKRGTHPFSAELALLRHARREERLDQREPACTEKKHEETFVAIDEVGRGCLAGPIVVCVTHWRTTNKFTENPDWINALRDSKKLSALQREKIFGHIQETIKVNVPKIFQQEPRDAVVTGFRVPPDDEASMASQLRSPFFVSKFKQQDLEEFIIAKSIRERDNCSLIEASIGTASATCIDRCGLIPALGVAASKALAHLNIYNSMKVIFFDGNRPLPLLSPWANVQQVLVTKGDDLLKSISTSSVIAKVVRDSWMQNYSQYFPEFAFNENKGYGTETHRSALIRLGPTPIHRTSFLKNICPELFP